MTIANLIKVVPPPAEPFWAYKGPWGAIEGELGTALPQDYKDYVALYGSGYFMQFLNIHLPKSWTVHLRLGAKVKFVAKACREIFKDDEVDLPFPIWPDPGGLMVFGLTGGGDYLFWLTRGTPQDWPIVVWDCGAEENELFDCDMTDFLTGIATGAFLSDVFDVEALACERKFEPYTDEDVKRAMDDPAEAADRLRAWRLSWTQVAKGTWGYVAREPLWKSH